MEVCEYLQAWGKETHHYHKFLTSWYSCPYVVFPTLYQGCPTWPGKWGGPDSLWLLTLHHKRHCHFHLAHLDHLFLRSRVMKTQEQLYRGSIWWETGLLPATSTNLLAMWGTILEEGPPAPVRLSDERSLVWHPDHSSYETLSQKHSPKFFWIPDL